MELNNICKTVNESKRQNDCVRLSLSTKGVLYQPKAQQSGVGNARSFTGKYVNLDSILRGPKKSELNVRLWDYNQCHLLTYKIASMLLQYHSTPWIQEMCIKQTIFFQSNTAAGPKTTLHFESNHPFITYNFTRSSATTSQQKPNVKYSLLDLGVLTLEVFHGESFETYATKSQLILDGSHELQSKAARQWLIASKSILLPPVWDVVERCIECAFNRKSTSPDWADGDFRNLFCEGVVKPMWDMCHSHNV